MRRSNCELLEELIQLVFVPVVTERHYLNLLYHFATYKSVEI